LFVQELQVRHNLADTVVVSKGIESPKSLIALSKVTLPSGQEVNLSICSHEKLKTISIRKKVSLKIISIFGPVLLLFIKLVVFLADLGA
jgi:hypothetical protein